MIKSLKFAKLDFCSIKIFWKSLMIMPVLGLIMGILSKSPEMLMGYCFVVLMLSMSFPFAIGEKNRLDMLYGTLSVNRKNVVVGRYLFVVIFALSGLIITSILSGVMTFASGKMIILEEFAVNFCVYFALISVVVSLQYPVLFKFNYTKGRMLSFIPLMVIFLVAIMVPAIFDALNLNIDLKEILDGFLTSTPTLPVILVILGFVFLTISCFISYKIYKKRDI